jgi:hypothetical protein
VPLCDRPSERVELRGLAGSAIDQDHVPERGEVALHKLVFRDSEVIVLSAAEIGSGEGTRAPKCRSGMGDIAGRCEIQKSAGSVPQGVRQSVTAVAARPLDRVGLDGTGTPGSPRWLLPLPVAEKLWTWAWDSPRDRSIVVWWPVRRLGARWWRGAARCRAAWL